MNPEIDAVLSGASRWCVVQGDCLDILPTLPANAVDAVVTDPPYGIKANRMTLGSGKKDFERGGDWDDATPDVRGLLTIAKKVCVWGGNYFTDQLPPSNDWLVWHKVNDGLSFSECELAWTNYGRQVRHISHHWAGEVKQHPTMKPRSVMAWCLAQGGFAPDSVVLDPYCGSGSTGVACMQEGYRFIGIEREAKYVEIATRRISDAAAQGNLFQAAQ